jgi:hypothetical protein
MGSNKTDFAPSVHMDQIDADKKALYWLEHVISLYELTKANCVIRNENLKGEGRVSSLWFDNKPIATAVILRDEFNFSTVLCTEHAWKSVKKSLNANLL